MTNSTFDFEYMNLPGFELKKQKEANLTIMATEFTNHTTSGHVPVEHLSISTTRAQPRVVPVTLKVCYMYNSISYSKLNQTITLEKDPERHEEKLIA